MSDEKPLHVQVAEALGCELKRIPAAMNAVSGRDDFYYACGCPRTSDAPFARDPHGTADAFGIYEYETDWSAAGPLIEKHGIELSFNGEWWFATGYHPWDEDLGREPVCIHIGRRAGFAPCADESETPLVAVCKAILEMKRAGLIG